MPFKETKGDMTVEACVGSAPGGMFKGYIRTTRKTATRTFGQSIGKGCGRPVADFDAAMALAEAEAKRILGK